MNKNKFLFIGLLGALLVFGMTLTGCSGNEEAWGGGGKPELTKLTIDGIVAGLGTPSENVADATAGSVTIKSSVLDDEGDPILTVDNPTISETPSIYTIKYAVTSDATPPGDEAYNDAKPASLKNNDYLWLEVAGKSTVYYVIKITVQYKVIAIKNHPISREFTLDGWNATGSAQTLTVEMDEESSKYQYQWYSNTSFSNTGGTPINEETEAAYKPVITAIGTYYYYVTVTISGEVLTSNAAMIKISSSITQADTEFTIESSRLNYVRGVGGSGSFMFRAGNGDASPDADEKYIDLLMGELGANILRIMVQDDYENYITNSIQSKNSDQFYHNAKDNFFPVIRKVNEYGGYVFANPWTAPARMKTTDSLIGSGSTLTPTGPNYVDYAEHLRNFLKWLNAHDAPIFALGILNEPDFGQSAGYEGMGMTGDVTRDWFRTVGHFTTQKVTNRSGAGITSSIFAEDIIPGYGGGKPTHHVLTMSGDSMGDVASYMEPQVSNATSNNRIELMGRHYYASASRYTKVTGNPPSDTNPTSWEERPRLSYSGPQEAASLAESPQMYAPGSKPRNIKREIWQTEHDFNFHGTSTSTNGFDVQEHWNSVFAALNDIDWCLRVNGESVFCWWYSSSFSGFVTSYQNAGFPPYTITPRGRAFAHYARYVNETWFLPIKRTRGTVNFNTTASFDAGSTDPKISAFEDVNGKFISVVMYTPSYSTASADGGKISNGYGQGGTFGNDDPRRGSTNVGRTAIVLPNGFIASSASAIRSYGTGNADGKEWDNVPNGTPRYWIDEPVFLSADGKSVEVTLPGGNIISIMIKGEWSPEYLASNPRYFEERVRPYKVK